MTMKLTGEKKSERFNEISFALQMETITFYSRLLRADKMRVEKWLYAQNPFTDEFIVCQRLKTLELYELIQYLIETKSLYEVESGKRSTEYDG